RQGRNPKVRKNSGVIIFSARFDENSSKNHFPPGASGVFESIEKGLPHKGEPLQTPSFNDID
ncbi:hypothetical protein, partial [Bifidobacterium adolescentis]|uniref:hypothetical protein n=2 Tax=Bifidobacterium adolescentis TaxID=1680 RepID=UPI0022DF7F58